MWRKIIDDYRLSYLNDLFEIELIFYGLSSMLQFSEFVWTVSYSVWDVFNNFLLIDVTDRSKISSDQKRFFNALSLYPLSFFANTPSKPLLFNLKWRTRECVQLRLRSSTNSCYFVNKTIWFNLVILDEMQKDICMHMYVHFINSLQLIYLPPPCSRVAL